MPGSARRSFTSDRQAKEQVVPVNSREGREKVAQDFHAAFAVGPDDKHISMVDAAGVALAAIQGLNQKVEEQRAENAELKQTVNELKELVQAMNQKLNGSVK